jgi:acyl-CoA synthetase (AMP-forming)/AMP-acid ligase II
MPFSLAEINEAIAAVIPEREAIVTAGRRFTWRDLQMRTRRLANLLIAAGLGCRRERDSLAPWESGQDHVALYLYNGNEYVEGMLGAYKARAVPFNVNYRYVEEELSYLLADAGTRGVIYHASFAPILAKVLPRLPEMAILLQVDDGSGEALLAGARDYERALADAGEERPTVQPSDDDLYIVYTGGTTGMPKGVMWRQRDIFFAAMGGRLPGAGGEVGSVEELVERAPNGELLRILPTPPFMHGAAQWSSFIILHQGGTVVLPSNPRRLDPHDIWRTVERERVVTMSIVGDAFARPLLDQLRRQKYDLSSLQILGSGGAILSPPLKKALLEAIPHVILFDGFGSSETGAQGSSMSTAGGDTPSGFRMDEHTLVLDESLQRPLRPGEPRVGWLARAGYLPLGYLNDREKTERTYPTIGGVRYAVPGDRAQVTADGQIAVFGRDSVCINTGGEKVFAEEVEQALKRHAAVYDVVVTGTANERWGQQVTAVVALRPGEHASEEELRETAAAALARYKLPKAFVFVDSIVRSASGKPDYRWARETAEKKIRDQ